MEFYFIYILSQTVLRKSKSILPEKSTKGDEKKISTLNPIVLWYYQAIKDIEELEQYSPDVREGVLINYIYAKAAYENLMDNAQKKLEEITEEY